MSGEYGVTERRRRFVSSSLSEFGYVATQDAEPANYGVNVTRDGVTESRRGSVTRDSVNHVGSDRWGWGLGGFGWCDGFFF